MKHLFILLILLSLSATASEYSRDRLIVKLKGNVESLNNKNIIRMKNLFENVHVVYTDDVDSLYRELKGDDNVVYVERDYKGTRDKLAKRSATPENEKGIMSPFNDPQVGRQWTLNDASRYGISINSFFEARRNRAENKIIVAVVDTGVDYNHEDLPMWTNENEIPGNGIDDDNNGYIDDIHGINTLVRDSEGNATMDMRDTHSHGTHVSGSIGAIQNNGVGIAGNASNVEIMGIRTVPNSSDEKDVDVVEAFIYAARNGAKVINCSFGKSHNEGGMAVSEAIEYIGREFGTIVVAAAGNSSQNIDTRLTYPASFQNDNLIVVASTTDRGSMSYFSNYGIRNVDVASPGSNIFSTVPGNRYSSMSGTSMASPNTAGVVAEIIARNPQLTIAEVKEVLMRSVTKVSSFSSKVASGGRIDLKKAIELAEQL